MRQWVRPGAREGLLRKQRLHPQTLGIGIGIGIRIDVCRRIPEPTATSIPGLTQPVLIFVRDFRPSYVYTFKEDAIP